MGDSEKFVARLNSKTIQSAGFGGSAPHVPRSSVSFAVGSVVPSEALLDALFADEDDAWVYVWSGVLGMLKRSRKYREILAKSSLQPEDIAGQVVEDLHANDHAKLRGYRGEGPFLNWLCLVVKTAVNKAARMGMKREILVDPEDPTGVIIETPTPLVSQAVKDRLQDSRIHLVRLWKDHPDRFWALFMKCEAGLSSQEIGAIMHTTEANVNTLTNRARNIMKGFELESGVRNPKAKALLPLVKGVIR